MNRVILIILSIIMILTILTGCINSFGMKADFEIESNSMSEEQGEPEELNISMPEENSNSGGDNSSAFESKVESQQSEPQSESGDVFPIPRLPLTEEMEERIKKDYCIFRNANIDSDEIKIAFIYWGTYNGYVSMSIYNLYGVHIQAIRKENVAGYEFIYSNPSQKIQIWKDGEFYTLTDVYEKGLLKENDIKNIYYYYNQ